MGTAIGGGFRHETGRGTRVGRRPGRDRGDVRDDGGRPGPLSKADIPDVPPGRVAYVDGYGNIKTTIERAELSGRDGAKVRVSVGGSEHEATVSDGSFSVAPGELALAPGSSGWADPKGRETRWAELFLRGGNARERFGKPAFGSEIRLS